MCLGWGWAISTSPSGGWAKRGCCEGVANVVEKGQKSGWHWGQETMVRKAENLVTVNSAPCSSQQLFTSCRWDSWGRATSPMVTQHRRHGAAQTTWGKNLNRFYFWVHDFSSNFFNWQDSMQLKTQGCCLQYAFHISSSRAGCEIYFLDLPPI